MFPYRLSAVTGSPTFSLHISGSVQGRANPGAESTIRSASVQKRVYGPSGRPASRQSRYAIRINSRYRMAASSRIPLFMCEYVVFVCVLMA